MLKPSVEMQIQHDDFEVGDLLLAIPTQIQLHPRYKNSYYYVNWYQSSAKQGTCTIGFADNLIHRWVFDHELGKWVLATISVGAV